MLSGSRASFVRTAVAFFNMKHFQAKKKYSLTPQNIHETFSTVLSPRDRLLRQSVSGSGGARVLVLDAHQRVKGVYLPVFCMPHPSTATSGSSSLGVAVADYTRSIEATSMMQNGVSGGTASPLPTVLVVMSHPQGLAYGTFRADGTPGVPMKNLALSPALVNTSAQQAPTNIISSPLQTSGLATVMPLLNIYQGRAEIVRSIYKELNENEHAAELAACSTFVWVQRDNMSSMTFETAQSSERYWERAKNEGDGADAPPPGSFSFLDRRWVFLSDAALRPDTGVSLYARNPDTGDRIVNAMGVQSALCRGQLLLDHIPRPTTDTTRAANTDTAGSG